MNMKSKSVATYMLASILTTAGVYNTGNASEPSAHIDDQTAAQIIRSLSATNSEELEGILSAKSIDDLSESQKATLLNMIQESAKTFRSSTAPLA
jgi:hypothetical protein